MSKLKLVSLTLTLLNFLGAFLMILNIFTNTSFLVFAGLGPHASFTTDRTLVSIGEAVAVDASASYDSRGTNNLQYRWDFESTYAWTAWGRSPYSSHIFRDAGERIIRLEVKDADGYTDETKVLIRVREEAGNAGPVSAFAVTPTTGDVNTFFKFTIFSAASAIGTVVDRLQFRWDFECDGTFDTEYATGLVAYHTYSESGLKRVCLETRDVDGVTKIEEGYYVTGKENDSARTREIGRILVNKSTQPFASFRTYPTSGVPGVNLHFDANTSINAQEFRWDFDGDGKFDTSWNADKQIQFVYNKVGTYHPILEVKNSTGTLDRTERLVTITEENRAAGRPTAEFTVRNMNRSVDLSAGVLLDKFYFDAGKSTAGVGMSVAKLKVRWDFEGDGTWDTTFSASKTAYHTYTAVGRFFPRVEVWGENGTFAQTSTEIRIVMNTPPTAMLSITPPLGTKTKIFTLDASQSFDSQSRLADLQFRFDFENDGTWDTVFSRASSVRRTFSTVGRRTAKVEVKDSSGALATALAKFEVAAPTPPHAHFSVTPSVGTFSTNFQCDARASFDPSGVGGRLLFRWDFDYTGANDLQFDTGYSATPTMTHRFTLVGRHVVRLSVKNEADQTGEFTQALTLHRDSDSLAILERRGIMRAENPDQLISRAELAKVIVKAAGIPVRSATVQKFTDVDQRQWSAPYINVVTARSWITPKNNYTFRPDWTVNRAEAVKIVVSALYPRVAIYEGRSNFPDVSSADWYFRFANIGATEDFALVSENNNFDASKPVTRAEVARIVAKLFTKYEATKYRVSKASVLNPQSFLSSILDVFIIQKANH